MPKNIVVAILEKKHFYDKEGIDRSSLSIDQSNLINAVSQPFDKVPSPNHGSLNQEAEAEF